MKKALLLILIALGTLLCFDALAQTWSFSCSGNSCLKAGVDAAGQYIGKSSGVVTGKGISQAVQDVIKYFLTFLSVIAVIYVMWAGAQMLLFPSSEESSEKTKKIIISVFVGIIIIWFAWWIVSTLFYVLNNNKVVNNLVPRAYAETQIRNIDFTTYSNKIRALKTQITSGYSPEVTKQLTILVDGAYDHLPDRADIFVNRQLYDKVKKAIADYDLHREEIDRGILENAIDEFLERAQTFSIQGQIGSNPQKGDAPLSVTLEAKNMIDASGTVIPDTNFSWWLRTPDGPKVLGHGKTINYEFKDEGTFTVYLTVNSASKNSRGFTDVVSFEDQTILEVGQPKLKWIIFFNEQLASDSMKVPTRDALQKVLIDATQTKFSNGYTIAKTEWDFGNGKGATHEGIPIIEAQDYKEGDFNVKLTLTRNDGEVFSKAITLKIGDPIASIGVNNKKPNKGETVIFEAKKATQEGVQYSWEIRKIGFEQPIYSTTGPRMEYAFKEVGRFSVSLLSSKDRVVDKETLEVSIESRPPVVRFLAEPLGPETPNTYVFDGTSTYDPDYPDNQSLKYEWYVNDKPVQLFDTNSSNSRGNFTFTEVGTHQVELHVVDTEGKSSVFKKAITIKSLLSINLNIRPQVAKRGGKVILSADANNGNIYEWTIGSKDIAVTETGRHVVTFEKSGTYPVTLKVTDRYGNINSIQRKIYVVDGDAPFSVIQLSTKSLLSETQKGACSGNDALIVDRVTPVSIVGDKSVNVGGSTTDLTYFWKIGINSSSSQKNMTHTFDELGCEKITLIVNDKKTGASHSSEEWVKVVNIPPKFSDIQVKVENIDQDPMRINLRMEGAKDPDGNISSYTWYYYTSNDEQPQGFRITTKPETSFTLPKINGRYYFSVVMEDANGLKVDTRDISEEKFSTPDLLVNQNISMPIIDFKANNTEVKYGEPVEFSVGVKNALGQDISKAAEYRWDIDGDGFYDTKTNDAHFTYKYTIPGEYHPKVKVTHRGLSTTKFITLNVVNRLNPQAAIQVIGDKIIAYNMSTGIIQSVSWFADDKKVSENKDYLIYTVGDGTFPSSIKIEVSDGKDTQAATFSIARNPKNKTLLKKIEKPLIVLTNDANGNVEEVPDNVVWKDPLKPLFFYLGESSGDIQYYAIDNDIDIDTDLSGGKDDDADNKGTASYRMGRPYSVPMGNKRTTIMRLRLLKSDGNEIDSRQIRVTRDFIAPLVDTENPAVIIKAPQVFNLSAEDKARLDKLRGLVQNVPDEERKELSRYLDQLGDIWYDRADRAETLLQFSQAVNISKTMTPELKTRILEQVNLIYTQGQQDAQEKDIARKMIADFLAKSSYKKDIFGDGADGNGGLLGQIIDNPEYYEQNKSIVQKIYDDYIKFDKEISDEAKAVIKDKLALLIGNPPVQTTTVPPVVTEQTVSLWSKIQTKVTALVGDKGPIVLWISIAVIGLLGLLVLAKLFSGSGKSSSREDSHGDNQGGGLATMPENNHGPDWMHADEQHDAHHDDHGSSELDTHASTPDWLKETESPFGEEDVLSKEVATTTVHTDTPTKTPDWMHEETPATPIIAEQTHSSDTTSHSEVPAWLQSAPETTTENTNTETPSIPALPIENVSGTTTEPQNVTAHDDIPDWLKGAEHESEPESESEKEGKNSDEGVKLFSPDASQGEPVAEEKSDSAPTSPHADLPDWLAGTHNTENATPETGNIPEQKENEDNIPSPAISQENPEKEATPVAPKNKVKKTSKKDAQLTSEEHLLEPAHDLITPAPDTHNTSV